MRKLPALYVPLAENDYQLIELNFENLKGVPLDCVDAGNNILGLPENDFGGDPRTLDGNGDGIAGVDMGADEYVPSNQPPVADAGADQTIECSRPSGSLLTLDGSGSSDPDSTSGTNDDIVSFEWKEGETTLGSGEILNYTFLSGTHTVTLVVTDSQGETDSDDTTIVIQDTTPPGITCSVSEDYLSPANHKMVDVGFTYSVTDNCDSDPDISISVTSDEPTNTTPKARGKKHCPDAEISDGTVLLRAECSKSGDGRVYMVTVNATDGSGNTFSASIPVKVKVHKKTEAFDSGQIYDATAIN